jgi:hypothetical protein
LNREEKLALQIFSEARVWDPEECDVLSAEGLCHMCYIEYNILCLSVNWWNENKRRITKISRFVAEVLSEGGVKFELVATELRLT